MLNDLFVGSVLLRFAFLSRVVDFHFLSEVKRKRANIQKKGGVPICLPILPHTSERVQHCVHFHCCIFRESKKGKPINDGRRPFSQTCD